LEWKELLDKEGRFKTPAELQALFRSRGIAPEDATACYCQSGGRASVEALALELAGYPKVKVYVRGWEQWSADADAPAEK
jgi:thiosulfate/3-mercaptopyruvate sulfurtransferase